MGGATHGRLVTVVAAPRRTAHGDDVLRGARQPLGRAPVIVTRRGRWQRVEVAALWVFLGAEGARPTRLPDWFVDSYGEAALGRSVGSRLSYTPPPAAAGSRPWPLRATDLDVLHHVNNAATWQTVEDEASRRGVVPVRAELEYGAAIEPADEVELRSATNPVAASACG